MRALGLDRALGLLSDPRFILGFVWGGFFLLSVALVVLMRTRWGQERPLRKCVILSLLAHLLLVAYATTVHVVASQPKGPGSAVIRIASIDTVPTDAVPQEGSENSDNPWDQIVAEPAPPDVAELPSEPTQPDAAEPQPPSAAPAADLLPPLPAAGPAVPESGPEPPLADIEPRPLAAPVAPHPNTLAQPAAAPQAAALPGPQPDALAKPASLPRDDAPPTVEPVPDPTRVLGQLLPLPPLPDTTPPGDDGFPIDATDALRGLSEVPAAPAPAAALLVPVTLPRSADPASDPSTASATATPAAPSNAQTQASAGGRTDSPPTHVTPEVYGQRLAPDRLKIVANHGGSADTEAAVNAALQWLVANQAADGRWDASRHGAGRESRTLGRDRNGAGAEADTGLTGLALLALLGAGHTHRQGEHADAVGRGIDFLLSAQGADGNLAGKAEVYAFMYCHGMAALALSEAYAMTGDARLERPVRAAIGYTIAAQNLASGGWRYRPNEQGDTSQLGWQLMALKSAELAGIALPERNRQGMVRFLNSVSSGPRGGLGAYRPGERPTRAMTAEALVCRQFLGLSAKEAGNEAAEFLLAELPAEGAENLYYWYYGTLGLYQLQGDAWSRWNAAVSTVLVRSQRRDGGAAGSWDPDAVWGGYGGRVFSTSLGALCLEVYYRYLPLYSLAAGRDTSPPR